jgi:phosphatidylglycerol lysyltransferase
LNSIDSKGEQGKIRDVVLRFGWNSTCYQLLNPGFQYWISRDGDAVVGYVEYASTRIVGGSPVCAFERLPDVVNEFESDSTALGLRVCYFAGEARLESVIARRSGYPIIQLGAQPVWKPATLLENINRKPSLRGQVNRALNKGLIVEEWSANRATRNPALEKLLNEWLSTRGLPSLHFLVEPETLSSLDDRRMFVALDSKQALGFLNASPIPERNGWLVEQFVRGSSAPNGTVELMLHHAAEIFAEEGYDYLTLGLSPLTQQAQTSLHGASPIIRFLLRWARAHGKRFYDFEGLEFFKTKFQPEYWEPIYAISNEPTFSLRTLYAVACAFTSGHPIHTVMLGVGKALRQEAKWIFGNQH